MTIVYLVVSHSIVLAAGFVFGKITGFRDAQPLRDARGKFIKRG